MAGAIATTPAQAPILLHKSSVQSTGPADPAAAAGPVAALRAAAKREAALVPATGGAAAAPAAAPAAEAVAEAATAEAAQTDPLLGASAAGHLASAAGHLASAARPGGLRCARYADRGCVAGKRQERSSTAASNNGRSWHERGELRDSRGSDRRLAADAHATSDAGRSRPE